MAVKHEECEKCEEHKAWEERLKLLEKIPVLMSWMNQSKGLVILLVLFLTVIFGIVMTNRTELHENQEKHERSIELKHERLTDQVTAISNAAASIRTDVAVLVRATDLQQKEAMAKIEKLQGYHQK